MWVLSRDFFGVAVATLLVYSAVAVAGQASGEQRVVRIAAPPIDQAALNWQIERSGVPARSRFINQTNLKAGDTPGTLLTRLAVADPAAARFLRENPAAHAIFAAPAGTEVRASVDARQQLHALSASVDHDAHGTRRLQISRQGSRFTARHEALRNEVAVQLRTVQVGDGLGPSLRRAGVPAAVALEFARQIEGRVDLGRDIGPDDKCRLVYEQFNREGAVVGHGRLLAAELTTRRGPLQMVWYAGDPTLPAAFYEPSGQPLKASPRATFVLPIAHARVTSHFGERTHPLFRSRDIHTGIDLAAAHGTQVAAAAGGVVEFAGRRTGYGNLVILHAGNYRTYYAHLSSFAKVLHAGSTIRQGESVGRVGSTGWATGAHLHFELRRGDQPINPLQTEILARDKPTEAQLRTFHRQTGPWIGKIALMRALSPPMIDS